MAERRGALLLNLGTPSTPKVADVRRYLREFLSDPRVLDMPALSRRLMLEVVILPFRPRRSAAAYEKIWTPEGSPLLVNGIALRDGVAKTLGDAWVVDFAMRYGEPSIASAVERLADAGISQLVVLPLFPQYSEAATGSALASLDEELARRNWNPNLATIRSFFDAPGFVDAAAGIAREPLSRFEPDFVLFSYHGLPERQLRATDPSGAHCLARFDCCDRVGDANRDCYRAHCFATTRALAQALELSPEAHSNSFQSRMGRTPWIQPFTDFVLPDLAARGVRRLAVICPSFTADCLETLEEIGIRAEAQWRGAGGEALLLVPAVNADPSWVGAVADMLRDAATQP